MRSQFWEMNIFFHVKGRTDHDLTMLLPKEWTPLLKMIYPSFMKGSHLLQEYIVHVEKLFRIHNFFHLFKGGIPIWNSRDGFQYGYILWAFNAMDMRRQALISRQTS